MSRIWNPLAFDIFGNPNPIVAPPQLRVQGGTLTEVQALSAQNVFAKFCNSARLSSVPNPTEYGQLPDGSRYKIVDVAGNRTMLVWVEGTEEAVLEWGEGGCELPLYPPGGPAAPSCLFASLEAGLAGGPGRIGPPGVSITISSPAPGRKHIAMSYDSSDGTMVSKSSVYGILKIPGKPNISYVAQPGTMRREPLIYSGILNYTDDYGVKVTGDALGYKLVFDNFGFQTSTNLGGHSGTVVGGFDASSTNSRPTVLVNKYEPVAPRGDFVATGVVEFSVSGDPTLAGMAAEAAAYNAAAQAKLDAANIRFERLVAKWTALRKKYDWLMAEHGGIGGCTADYRGRLAGYNRTKDALVLETDTWNAAIQANNGMP